MLTIYTCASARLHDRSHLTHNYILFPKSPLHLGRWPLPRFSRSQERAESPWRDESHLRKAFIHCREYAAEGGEGEEDGPAPQSLKFSDITRYEPLWNQGYNIWPSLFSNSCWDLRTHTGRRKRQMQSLLLVKNNFKEEQGRASWCESRRNFHYSAAKWEDRMTWQDPREAKTILSLKSTALLGAHKLPSVVAVPTVLLPEIITK